MSVVNESILEVTVDVIVSATNELHLGLCGIAKVIFKAAGKDLESFC